MEIFYSLLYAFIIGFYNIFKKLSLRKSHEASTLVIFTSVAFLLSCIWIPLGVNIPLKLVGLLALKGAMLALSWYIILKVLNTADLSLVTATNIISAIFSFVAGIILFNEAPEIVQIIGSILILVGIFTINLLGKGAKGKIKGIHFVMLIISALITTTSTIIDKYTTTYLTPQQVQFWFLLFTFIFSWIFFAIECIKKKEFLIKKNDLKNFWIFLAGLFLFLGDIFLFTAYKVPHSEMITITILSKLRIIVTVFAGIIIFKEKNILGKILLTLLIIIGAIMVSI